jgi:hypothetical protein
MQGSALQRREGSAAAGQRAARAGAYSDSASQLHDYFVRLDLQIQRLLLLEPLKQTGDLSTLVGIGEAEVRSLLARRPALSDASASREALALDQSMGELEALIAERTEAALAAGRLLPLDRLVASFGLSNGERDVLVGAAAVELDRKYERLYGYLQDDMSRRRPSIGLLSQLTQPSQPGQFPQSVALAHAAERRVLSSRASFTPASTLFRQQLLVVADEEAAKEPFPARAVRVDERIVAYLVGEPGFDARLGELVSSGGPAADAAAESSIPEGLAAWLDRQFRAGRSQLPITLYLHGSERADKLPLARAVCQRLGIGWLQVDLEELALLPGGAQQGLALALREGLLAGTALIVDHLDRWLERDTSQAKLRWLLRCLDAQRETPVFLVGQRAWCWDSTPAGSTILPFEVPRASSDARIASWRRALAGHAELSEAELSRLASLYPLPLASAVAAVALGEAAATLRGDTQLRWADISRGCGQLSQPNLGRFARKVDTRFGWDDVVLPDAVREPLAEICAQARQRCQVYGCWGFGDKHGSSRGINILFSGPSGTGKTMSAQIIAAELGLELYAIDLSQVASKYIGETEKNLHQIFTAAEAANAILFFDEADALIGKRSEVKDAHDRYANMEVAYLLQKMEEYEGITILATNMRRNIDEAFTRRIRFLVEFPLPDDADRLRIWQRVWPEQTPLGDDVDLPALARQYRFAGGNIRNAALSAAFLAAEAGEPIQMRHLQLSARRELQKMGRLVEELPARGGA